MDLGFAGRFTVKKQKVRTGCDGSPLLDASGAQVRVGEPWVDSEFDNLITDVGLNNLGKIDPLQYIYLSTNNVEPSTNDSSITGFLASSKVQSNFDFSEGLSNKISSPYYVSCLYIASFAAGIGTGNIAKIGTGAGSNGTDLWSAALVNNNGTPTVITKLPDEILEITYELRTYIDLGDYVGAVDISGAVHNIILRVSDFGRWGGLPLKHLLNLNLSEVYDGDIQDAFKSPLGSKNSRVLFSQLSYVESSNEIGFSLTLSITEGNFSNGIKSLKIMSPNTRNQYKYWQISFTPPIMKTATDTLRFPPFYIKWGRYVAT